MLRYSVITFRKILQPKVLYSTSVPSKLKKPIPLVVKLMAEFENISCITRTLQNKELRNINFEEWNSRIKLLRNYQFTDADCFKMISDYPNLLKIPLNDFGNSVKQWFQIDFGLQNFQFLLLNQPHLIGLDIDDIRERVPELRTYFRTSEALCKLLVASPNVMFDDWNTVREKLHYVTKIKKFNMGDIVESQILSKSFNFIKFRFELLEKCGIYKQDDTAIHKINKHDKTRFKNPSLKEIVDPDDGNFIKTAKISHEEYAICKELSLEQDGDENDEDENIA